MLGRVIAVILLISLLLGGVYALTEPRELPYPPLTTEPSDMTVDDDGLIWLALPREGAVARYDPSTESLNIVKLPFAAERLAYSGGVILAYARGSGDAVLMDASARPLTTHIRIGFPIEYAVQSAGGFWLLSSIGDEVVQLSLQGAITRRIKAEFFTSEQSLSESDGYLWVVAGSGSVLQRLGLDSDSREVVDVNGTAISIAAYSSDRVWVLTTDDRLALYSTRGLIREVQMRSGSSAGARIYALSDGRLYHVSPSIGIVTEIDGESRTERPLRPSVPRLSSLIGGKVYYLDPKRGVLGYLHTSRPPVIELRDARVEGGSSIIVEARVMDRDGDLKDGYPRVLVRQSGLKDKAVEMERRGGDDYFAEVEIEIESGEAQLVIQAIDEAGNEALQFVGRYPVSSGVVRTGGGEETTTPTQAPPREEVEGAAQSSLTLLLFEAALTGSMLIAIVALALRQRRRRRRPRRR